MAKKQQSPDCSEGDVFITRMPDGRYGAVRVLRREGKSSVLSTTPYLGHEKPLLTDPLLRMELRQKRFSFNGQVARSRYDGPPPASFEKLGNLPLTPEEAKIQCNSYSGSWGDSTGNAVWLEWRWEHDRAAFEEEIRREDEERARAQRKPQKPKKMMDEAEFWAIIALLDWQKTGDDDAVLEPAIAALAQRSKTEICRFYERLAFLLYQLDTRAHAQQCTSEGELLSADGFLYTRCCVVANGKDFYESVLHDPTKLPKDLEFESLLELAPRAYERRTGEEMDYLTGCDFETYSNVSGWKK